MGTVKFALDRFSVHCEQFCRYVIATDMFSIRLAVCMSQVYCHVAV